MPNFDEHNIRSVEFEAPLSSDGAAPKHFSIDLSLELERQLDMEAYPPTPTQPSAEHPHRESLDPHILAHIVKQLRDSLADVTKDRDELRQLIASSHANEAELQDALQHMIDKATTMEVELSDARKKIKDDEEAITLLRSKVEESRRGLMRLQTESRRQSQIIPSPLDLSRSTLPSLGSPPASKRASFIPLTGNLSARPQGHRRISSVTDTSLFSSSPPSQTLTFPEPATSHPPSSSKRYSGLFGPPSPNPPHGDGEQAADLEALRTELRRVKDELETVKHELSEANEAREASDTCVKALREFIGEHNVGVKDSASTSSVKPPLPPLLAKGEEDDKKTPAAPASGWGFRLWKDAPPRPSPTVPQSATIASPATAPQPQMPYSASPLSRKIGGFFGSRSSISSDLSFFSSTGTTPAVPQLQTNAANAETYSVSSDTSSLVEPLSPPDEMPTNVLVRDLADNASARMSLTEMDGKVDNGVP